MFSWLLQSVLRILVWEKNLSSNCFLCRMPWSLGGKPGIFWISVIFSLKQRLRPLGCWAPTNKASFLINIVVCPWFSSCRDWEVHQKFKNDPPCLFFTLDLKQKPDFFENSFGVRTFGNRSFSVSDFVSKAVKVKVAVNETRCRDYASLIDSSTFANI